MGYFLVTVSTAVPPTTQACISIMIVGLLGQLGTVVSDTRLDPQRKSFISWIVLIFFVLHEMLVRLTEQRTANAPVSTRCSHTKCLPCLRQKPRTDVIYSTSMGVKRPERIVSYLLVVLIFSNNTFGATCQTTTFFFSKHLFACFFRTYHLSQSSSATRTLEGRLMGEGTDYISIFEPFPLLTNDCKNRQFIFQNIMRGRTIRPMKNLHLPEVTFDSRFLEKDPCWS